MQRINLLRNTGELPIELSLVHFSGEEEGVSTVTELIL